MISAGSVGGIGVGKFSIYDRTSGTSRLIIDASGNVGIGTTSPSQRLDVAGYVKGQSGLCIGNDCRTAWPSGTGTGTVTQLNQGGGIILSPNPITTTGTISLATQNCPSGQFVTGIGGAIRCAIPPGGGGYWALSGSNIYNTNSGNVGIGTTGPGQKLDVSGNLLFIFTISTIFTP